MALQEWGFSGCSSCCGLQVGDESSFSLAAARAASSSQAHDRIVAHCSPISRGDYETTEYIFVLRTGACTPTTDDGSFATSELSIAPSYSPRRRRASAKLPRRAGGAVLRLPKYQAERPTTPPPTWYRRQHDAADEHDGRRRQHRFLHRTLSDSRREVDAPHALMVQWCPLRQCSSSMSACFSGGLDAC